jgi:predicted AAA+ superfamily ATPase
MDKIYPRWQADIVRRALRERRVVILSGVRQCGKTTLAKQIITDKDIYRTLDNVQMLQAALSDPLGFVKHSSGTLVIDEIQKAPMLLTAIKQAVDENNEPGQFLITGSTDIQKHPEVTESLAGRVKNVRLRGLSIGERLEAKPTFLDKSFRRDWASQIKGYDKKAVIELAFAGSYPEALSLEPEKRIDWYLDYISSLLTRDLRDIINIRRKDNLKKLLEVFASWSSKFIDTATICSKLGISRSTYTTYAGALESLYLFDKISSWVNTDYDRVGRREKTFAADTGLMAAVLGWQIEEVLLDSDKSGKLLETLAYNELAAQIGLDYQYSLFHYRDREKREVDYIVENRHGSALGIEVKAGSFVSTKECRHLKWLKDKFNGGGNFTGIVLYTGEQTLPLGQDLYAVPIASIWS